MPTTKQPHKAGKCLHFLCPFLLFSVVAWAACGLGPRADDFPERPGPLHPLGLSQIRRGDRRGPPIRHAHHRVSECDRPITETSDIRTPIWFVLCVSVPSQVQPGGVRPSGSPSGYASRPLTINRVGLDIHIGSLPAVQLKFSPQSGPFVHKFDFKSGKSPHGRRGAHHQINEPYALSAVISSSSSRVCSVGYGSVRLAG